MSFKNSSGFTLIEIIIAILIISLLATIVIPDFISFKKKTDLDNNVQEFVSTLKLAQNKTLSSENNSQYGVYLNTAVSPNQYILFKGVSYASRIVAADQIYYLQSSMEFYGISLGGGNEIVFDKLTGASQEQGNISIRIKIDTGKNKTIYISNSGTVSFNSLATPSDADRIKDSRHIEFVYNRIIDTLSENIILTFDSGTTTIVKISLYLVGGELQWKDTISVGGVDQVVEINTHRLNSLDTLFSIHRDRRYNNKSLDVTITNDSSGYLARYSADGATTSSSSIYVSNFEAK